MIDTLDPDDKLLNGFMVAIDASRERLPRRVAWNTLTQASARVVTLALSVLTTVLPTRHLGVSGYGVYVTVTVYLSFFAVFFHAGVTDVVVRMLGLWRCTRPVRDAIGLRIVLHGSDRRARRRVSLSLSDGVPEDKTIRHAIAVGLPLRTSRPRPSSATTALLQARLEMTARRPRRSPASLRGWA